MGLNIILIEHDDRLITGTYELLPKKMMKVTAPGLESRISSWSECEPGASARRILNEMCAQAKVQANWQILQLQREHLEH